MTNIPKGTFYKPNTPQVVHQTIEGETILIDFVDGSYYSLDGSASSIWELLCGGNSVEDIIASFVHEPKDEPDLVAGEIENFVSELEKDSLIVPDSLPEDGTKGAIPKPDSGQAATTRERKPFTKPALTKYTDLQDLLLLDPIHEVEEQGWPIRR
jgi:hypothetical protein